MNPARTRIAPSPTGYMHIGNLRTALYCYFLAKQTSGSFLIRIEDTDQQRLVKGATEHLLTIFETLGIGYDEGPVLDASGELVDKGDRGPYIQSRRLALYQEHVELLLKKGEAYYCFCTKERLDEMRESQRATKQTPKYDRTCLRLSEEEVRAKLEAGEDHVVRMRVPEGATVFDDAIRGTLRFEHEDIDDQVLMKSDGYPTYHLAVVVDDHFMNITHVLRGEEWIPSTPKHILLYQMFGWEPPQFAHLPLLLNPDKTKLSKRQGDVAVEDYLTRGYLPHALINFVALLGFNPKGDQELYSIDELITLFDLSKVNKSGAVLNMEKLDWMNQHYLSLLSMDDLAKAAERFLQADINSPRVRKALMIERARVHRLDEFQERLEDYITDPSYDPAVLVWKQADAQDAKKQLEELVQVLEVISLADFEDVSVLEQTIKTYIAEKGLQNGPVLWPLRTALSGKERSASPFEFLWVLGKEESLARVKKAITLL